MCDVVARSIRDPVRHLIHSRGDLLHEVRLVTDYLIHDNVGER